MRNAIWRYLTRNLVVGCYLPKWALAVRWVLYPLDTLANTIVRSNGYQPETNTWLIGGVKYSDNALRQMSSSRGHVYRFYRQGDVVLVEQIADS